MKIAILYNNLKNNFDIVKLPKFLSNVSLNILKIISIPDTMGCFFVFFHAAAGVSSN